MKKTTLVLTVATMLTLPPAVTAQGFGIGARVGTIGLGAEGAVGLGTDVALRAGFGVTPLTINPSSFWDPGQDVKAELKLPKTWYNVGIDLYPGGGGFRIGGGMLFKPDNPTLTGTLAGNASIEIGGVTYQASQLQEVVGTLESKKSAPYVLIGFGNEIKSGIGLFLDLGVAFLGEPNVVLEGTEGSIINDPAFQQSLRNEETKIENDVGSYLKYWPIANIGIKVGIGG